MKNLSVLRANFGTEDKCLTYLYNLKWSDGYNCSKCGHDKFYNGRTKFYRKCRKCMFDESATSGTLFHKLKFPLVSAFEIIYWLTQTTKGMASTQIAVHFNIRQSTAWKFKKKVQLSMAMDDDKKLKGKVHVDEFILGGKEKMAQGRSLGKKHLAVVGVELVECKNKKKGVSRAYSETIDGFATINLRPFFNKRVSKKSKIKTDKWRGYIPLKEDYNLKMAYSDSGKNFNELHLFILNLKKWIKGIHHSICNWHFQGYLDEFCYRFNNRFNASPMRKLIKNMMGFQPIYSKDLYFGN